MKKVIVGLVLSLSLTAASGAFANPQHVRGPVGVSRVYRPGYVAKWLCESVPTWGPGYYWWLSYNYALSFRNATYACEVGTRMPCYTACRVVW